MRNSTFFARFAQHLVLFSTCLALTSCTSKAPSENGANEGDGGIADDQTCPEEGCETDIVCASDRDCPSDDRCRPHWCHTGSATCRWQLLDRDGDGFVPEVCGGRDCDDTPPLMSGSDEEYLVRNGRGRNAYPGARELCGDNEDNDCDGRVDELPDTSQSCDNWKCDYPWDRFSCVNEDWGNESESEGECIKNDFDVTSTDGEPGRCNAQDAERTVEPDNARFETAPVLNAEATDPVFGEFHVCWPGDVDIYRWRVTDAGRQDLCVAFRHNRGDLDAALYDPDLNLVDLAQSCDDNEQLQIPAGHEGEIWYIVVNGWDGATNSYTIRGWDCP